MARTFRIRTADRDSDASFFVTRFVDFSMVSLFYMERSRCQSFHSAILLWMGKPVFNIFNAFISVLLIIEIYWCANKGIVTFDFKMSRLLYIFFALWAFTPAFSSVFLWLTGACNYLWTVVLLLGFLLPFVHKFYFFEKNIPHHKRFTFSMFVFGMIAGWTTENSICWIILVLLVLIYANREKLK